MLSWVADCVGGLRVAFAGESYRVLPVGGEPGDDPPHPGGRVTDRARETKDRLSEAT